MCHRTRTPESGLDCSVTDKVNLPDILSGATIIVLPKATGSLQPSFSFNLRARASRSRSVCLKAFISALHNLLYNVASFRGTQNTSNDRQMPQIIGVPKETAPGEKRVAAVPEIVEK